MSIGSLEDNNLWFSLPIGRSHGNNFGLCPRVLWCPQQHSQKRTKGFFLSKSPRFLSVENLCHHSSNNDHSWGLHWTLSAFTRPQFSRKLHWSALQSCSNDLSSPSGKRSPAGLSSLSTPGHVAIKNFIFLFRPCLSWACFVNRQELPIGYLHWQKAGSRWRDGVGDREYSQVVPPANISTLALELQVAVQWWRRKKILESFITTASCTTDPTSRCNHGNVFPPEKDLTPLRSCFVPSLFGVAKTFGTTQLGWTSDQWTTECWPRKQRNYRRISSLCFGQNDGWIQARGQNVDICGVFTGSLFSAKISSDISITLCRPPPPPTGTHCVILVTWPMYVDSLSLSPQCRVWDPNLGLCCQLHSGLVPASGSTHLCSHNTELCQSWQN